jgi:Na+/H+ antiporter NhaA
MDAFQMYVSLGIQHIADLQGYDHLVFLVALCTIYSFSDWKKILAIITLFTIGHTITLFIAAFGLVNVHGPTIELLIALTILTNRHQQFNQARSTRFRQA